MLTTVRTLALVQGLFLAGVLWSHPGNRSANRWLAAALAAYSLLTLGDVLSASDAINRLPHLAYAFDWLIFLVGPLIYRYVVALTSDARLRWRAALAHALPALLALAILTPIYLWPAEAKLRALRSDLAAPPHLDPLLVFAAVQLGAYWVASWWRWQRFRHSLRSFYSNLDALKVGWLTALLATNLLVWASWLVTLLMGLRLQWFEATVSSLAIYSLGYLGLRRAAVFGADGRARDAVVECAPDSALLTTPPNTPGTAVRVKYAKSALPLEQLDEHRQRLERFMQLDKPFLEDDLTLLGLAARLSLSAHQLSQVLSVGLGQTFYEYINRHRVAEVQRCLQDRAYADQTILEIALASGFGSKAAFGAAFKKYAGATPSAERERSLAKANPAGQVS